MTCQVTNGGLDLDANVIVHKIFDFENCFALYPDTPANNGCYLYRIAALIVHFQLIGNQVRAFS